MLCYVIWGGELVEETSIPPGRDYGAEEQRMMTNSGKRPLGASTRADHWIGCVPQLHYNY